MIRKILALTLSFALMNASISICAFAEEEESDLLVSDEQLLDEVITEIPVDDTVSEDMQTDLPDIEQDITITDEDKTEDEDKPTFSKEANTLKALGILV